MTNSRTTLLKDGDILNEESVPNTFNEFFSNVVKELKIEKYDKTQYERELKNTNIIKVFWEEKVILKTQKYFRLNILMLRT